MRSSAWVFYGASQNNTQQWKTFLVTGPWPLVSAPGLDLSYMPGLQLKVHVSYSTLSKNTQQIHTLYMYRQEQTK